MEWVVQQKKQNLKTSQDNQKSYVDAKHKTKEFQVGDHVLLRVKPKRISLRAKTHTKIAPRFVGPFKIIARVGPIAYQLGIHDVFHVSLLKKYIFDKTRVIDQDVLQVELEGEVLIEPVRIIDLREIVH